MPYELYQYNIPKVSEDGKRSIPVSENQSLTFTVLNDASKCAFENKDRFDRIVLIEQGDDGIKMIERYIDGKKTN